MSSFTHPVDSGESEQSLLSRRQSEMGSQYAVESGIFMSSFTATVFVAALATTGLLILTLLIALTVMLKSCQSTNSGILEQVKKINQHDCCNFYILHAELNNLEVNELPLKCKLQAHQYSKRQYLKDLNTSIWFVEDYFGRLTPDDDGLDIILLDADDMLSLTGNFSRISSLDKNEQFEDIKHQASILLVRMHIQLRASGWSLFLFTRDASKHRNTRESTLTSFGCIGWASLLMRYDDEIQMEDWEYLSRKRLQLHNKGFRILGLISSSLDAFRGPSLGRRSFKLPNLQYYMNWRMPTQPN
ncbi:uncharacterized protein At2g39920 [Phalaenopsis equestris]|uniref:uncharacterized protein At2g39920 n=1 Tax=Phalaenopsis equestris TaxID=78828 RepID=UPI0009E5380B|nr:uncharacterized protein At2g39920 [Phalaenopsis equestris]XP_020571195.1 uncharacterized protein At2g39920 [Phalaenopsis equestris]XP_020571196.1 uncharacterized protein At2g39920 [Phalaenopsis equestris]